ncbi:efflux transporter outer membrane subunit [Paucibacter sp. R3-3]|uniref:Efflux transporter outer membrane subunit n=1 Tax=Roseateles agri TaxID=3098619 RepID=A0ABU5DFS3_9BURK|nr:efflux transporter outer membrane subunit [Paucibacter sp. R3-3]MDY0744603.1 efflux transporter outer membrane subunit [Paucibacter sp. R3-3]
MTTSRYLHPLHACLPLVLALAACTTVGPDYKGAPPVAADALAQSHFTRDGGASTAPAPAQWWRSLNDATLDTLVDDALRDSPTLHAAEARLRAARASLNQQEANRRPSGSASALGAGVWQGPTTDQSTSLQLYSVGFDATWEADLFGGGRRAVESASAQAQAVQADLADAQVSLAAEVAATYTDLRAQQARRALLQQTAAGDAQALALMRQRRAQGVASADEVEQRMQQAAATQGTLSDLTADIAASLDRLALLVGQAPGALDAQLAATVASPALPSVPASVAIGDPAALLQHRPDIRAAERRLAGRTADIGQQTAKYFPKLNLLGNIGLAGTDAGQLLRASNLALIAVPYLSWNVLDFGRTAAAVRQAEAGRDEAVANYQATVLGALQDANTALARFGQQRQTVMQLLAQQASAGRTLELTQQRRAAGASSQIDLLDAQRRDADARVKALEGEAQLLKNFVALQKSLGLGWDVAG